MRTENEYTLLLHDKHKWNDKAIITPNHEDKPFQKKNTNPKDEKPYSLISECHNPKNTQSTE